LLHRKRKHTLLVAQHSLVEHLALHLTVGSALAQDLHLHGAIVQQDARARLHSLLQLGVGYPDAVSALAGAGCRVVGQSDLHR
jgi:hypothetical protein